jgi:hypothetical protein
MGHHRLRAAAGASPADPYFSSTSLLLLGNGTNGGQNNTFVDSSTNNFAVTRNGNTTQGSFSPFTGAGGSGYFDGSGDSLKSSPLGIYSTNFTVEAWIYISGGSGTRLIAATYNIIPYQANTLIISVDSSNKISISDGLGGSSSSAVALYAWHHVAAVYTHSNTTITLYVNGVSAASYVGSITQESANGFFVGGSPGDNNLGTAWFNGYISNLRVTKSTVYTSNFTPPTSPLTAITNTSLLLNFTNCSIIDSTGKNDLETVGDAQISTSVKKFGTGSLKFDGTGDYLVVNGQTSDFAFGTGDFTIEFWLYINTASVAQIIYDGRPSGVQTTQPCVYVMNDGTIRYYVSNLDRITGSSLSTSTWYHIALARSGTSTKLFVNGTQSGSTYSDSTNYTNTLGRPVIGVDGFNGANQLNGYIDDLRITKGVARYTSAFTPPSAQLPAR